MVTEPGYFERLYAESADPWQLSSSVYEARKYALTVAALPNPRYARAFEPGCAIGVLSTLLSARCDELLAWDGAASAVAQSRTRSSPPAVVVERRLIPADWPLGSFDLVVLSELLYFLDRDERRRTLGQTVRSLRPGGHLVAVHWRHPFDEAPSDGDRVHNELRDVPGMTHLVEHVERDFRLDVLEKPAPDEDRGAAGVPRP